MKTQLNVEIPTNLLKQVKKDAVEFNVTMNEYARQAFEKFRGLSIAQRRVYLDNKDQRRTSGRKISVEKSA